ncbi:MAG: type II toxin-antitoxin system VapC family toxin [Phycisphaerae bacterium]
MSALLADTHAVVWYLLDSPNLSDAAKKSMEAAVANGDPIFIASISLVEIIYLVEKGRLPSNLVTRIFDALADSRSALEVVSLDLPVARAVSQIPRKIVPDLPDRIIVATAIYLNVPLITRDQKILAANIPTIW